MSTRSNRSRTVHINPAAERALANPRHVAESIAAVLERPIVTEVSNTPWSQFSQADYDISQWRRACLIDSGVGNPDSKDRYKLPVREPGGALNRNAIHAAAGGHGVSAVTGVSKDKKKAAARKLAALYRNELGEDPPPSLVSMAGQGEAVGAPTAGHHQALVTETPTIIKTAAVKPGRLLIQLIKAGWSANGRYYPAEVLKRDGPKAFPAGTQGFIDHPTEQEDVERPAGSLTKLASVMTKDAYYDPARKALMGEVRVFAPWREALTDMADHIGVSIRVMAEGEDGRAEGKDGWIVSALAEGRSVDYVTKPAAGGAIVAVLESVNPQTVAEARNIGVWMESRLHLALTQLADDMYGNGRLSREERIAVSGALGDALKAYTTRVEADAPGLFKRDLYDEPGETARAASEAQEPETDPASTDPPAEPDSSVGLAAEPPAQPTQDPPPTDEPAPAGEPDPPGTEPAGSASTEESRMTDNPGVQAPTSPGSARQVIEAELAQMRTQMSQMAARETARSILAAALSDGWIPPATVTRITESLLVQLPVTNGVLDEAELTKRVGLELRQAELEFAEALQASGRGLVKDLGQAGSTYSGRPGGLGVAEAESRLEKAFRTLGNSEKVAKVAAKGRD